MHEHTDKPCKHDLRACAHCGDVYCAKCKKEWFKEKVFTYWAYPYYGTYTAATYSQTITVGGVDSPEGITGTSVLCLHS